MFSNLEKNDYSVPSAFSSALGFLVGGSLIYNVKDIFQTSFGMSPVSAFRTVVAIYSVIGFVLLCIPVIFLDEKRYCTGYVSSETPIQSIMKAFSNRDFVIFTASNTVYSMADVILQLALVYFITVLIGLKESWVAVFGASCFGLSFVWYFFVNVAAAKISKKKIKCSGKRMMR